METSASKKEVRADLINMAARIHQNSVLMSDIHPADRMVGNLDELEEVVGLLKTFGAKIVLTMGTFDLFHVGHARYIRKARQHGDLLIVGVDDDEKARGRKGENRPAVPYIERSELLGYLRHVDLIALKANDNEKWAMIKVVRPAVLIAVVGTYTDEELTALREFCGEVVVLERQAETSTSAKIRKMILDGADRLKNVLAVKLPAFVDEVYQQMKKED